MAKKKTGPLCSDKDCNKRKGKKDYTRSDIVKVKMMSNLTPKENIQVHFMCK